MTALCGGGTSSSVPGFPLTVVLSAASIEAALILMGMPELAAIASVPLAGLTVELLGFCSTDPPPPVTLGQQDINDLLDFANPLTSSAAADKFRQWFQNWYWCQVCRCDNGTIPNCAKPNNPGSLGTTTGVPTQPTQGCYNGHAIPSVTGVASTQTQIDATSGALPTTGTSRQLTWGFDPFTHPATVWSMPANIQAVTLTTQQVQADPALAAGTGAQLAFMTLTSSSGIGHIYTFTTSGHGPYGPQRLFPGQDPTIWPVGADYWGIVYATSAETAPTPVAQVLDLVTSVECAGAPLSAGCCPPDPTIDARLNAILQILQQLQLGTPASNSYATSTTHSNLSGSVLVSLGRTTIGVQVQILNIPPSWPENPQLAPYYYSLGFLTPFAISYAMRGSRIIHSGQIFPLPAECDQVAIDLAPGLVANLVELTPATR